MDPTLVFTILGFLLAIYAIVPTERKLDLKIRLNWLDWTVVLSAIIIIHYILYFPILDTLGIAFNLGSWRWGFNENNTIYLVILLTSIFLILRIRRAPLRRTKILAFRDLANQLFQEQKYSDVLSLLRHHHKNLFRIYNANFFLPKLRKKINPEIVNILRFLDEFQELESKKNLYQRLKTKLTSFRFKIVEFLPQGEKHTKIAEDVIRRIFLSEEFVEYIVKVDPYFVLNLLNYEFQEKKNFLDLYISQLLKYKSGIVYFEIKNNQTISAFNRYKIDHRNRFISYFLKDSKIAEKFEIYRPFGEFSIRFLENLKQTPDHDKYNRSIGNYYEEERWYCPIHASLRFFDFMVLEALYQGINWHMWLYYWPIITDKIIDNISPSPNIDLMREWPTPYHFLLYEIISTLTTWIEAVEHISIDQENIKLKNDDINYDNGNIPKSSIIALSQILHSVMTTEFLELKFKAYLLETVLLTIKNLKNIDRMKPFVTLLRKAIKKGGPLRYKKDENYDLMLNQALENVDDYLLKGELEEPQN